MALSESLLQFDRRNPDLAELPDEVAIELVMGCNLRCPMCPVSGLPHSMNGRRPTMMTEDRFRRVIGQISDRPRSILLNVFGESLLHPKFVEFVRIAKAPGHHVAVISNGTKLTRALSGAIIDAGLDACTISIDGIAGYRRMRVGADLATVLANLGELASENVRRGNPLRIEINFILSKDTAAEAASFHAEFAPLVSVINFTPVTDFGGHWRLPRDMPEDAADPRLVSLTPRLPARTPCPHLWRALWVSAEGRVMLCTNDFKQYSTLPTIDERPLLEIWREDVGRLRREQVEGRFDREPCRSCRLNDVPSVRDPAERRRLAAAERREQLMARVVPAALLPARYRHRRVLRAEPIGFLDNPVANSTIGGITIVQGWACGRSGRTIERIDILVDGVPQGRARYDQFRPDVGEANPGDGHSFSGFSYTLHTAALGNGPHALGVTLTDSASRVRTLDPRPVVVRN